MVVDAAPPIEAVRATASDSAAYGRRWWILAVLCLSLLIVGIDGTIVNVALPSIVCELGASSSQLQWIVDAYTLVFASFLLLAGSLGDRYGRKTALTAGLLVFGAGSLASALVGSAGGLILTRAVQGFGAAFIMPATLSILTNVFPDDERGRAIGIWAGVSGVGVAVGPITGGYLLEHFYWGSIFLVNMPVIAVALVAGWLLVPNSRDPHAPKLDLVGTVLSVTMLFTLLYGIIEGPTRGWSDSLIVAAFVVGTVLLIAFALWELHSDHPMLDVTFFKNPRFSAASIAVTLVFFAMFGSLFFLSQYLQFVLGYDPLQSGVRLLPIAAALVVAAPLSPLLVARVGTKIVVTAGLVIVAIGMWLLSYASVGSGYGLVAGVLSLLGVGMAIAMAPATDSIMGSLPPEKAGVGSAVNDTTREIGGALGVAILGSITASSYRSEITSTPVYTVAAKQSHAAASALHDSVGSAAALAAHLPASSAKYVTAAANAAFVHALDHTVIVGAIVALLGAAVAAIFLPARPAAAAASPPGMHDLVVATAQRLPSGARTKRDAAGAVLQLFTEAGFSSLTFHGVASRSGVSTNTIERYWRSRVEMVADAVEIVLSDVPVADTGSFRDDCETYLAGLSAVFANPSAKPVITQLINESARDPDLAVALRSHIVAPRRGALLDLIGRAVTRGQLADTTDRDTLADLLVAPLYYRALVSGEPVTTETAHRIVSAVLDGSRV
ncbi:MAG TPA: DHA2 family efflux MFS transporter permease subunit [Acidimicrobiia bacterium]